jgi:DNA-binding HxlR family transcriptional regulator
MSADPIIDANGQVSLIGQFCPIAMAAELLATRWTLVIVSELLSGSTHFNEIRRGVPRIPPALLSKRLRELRDAGVITQHEGRYFLTPSGRDLEPIVQALGRWALRWAKSDCSLTNLDVRQLMWNMRRNLRPWANLARKTVVQFSFPQLPLEQRWHWLIIAPEQPVDLCSIDPGAEVDLLVTADLRALTSAWLGLSEFEEELEKHHISLDGDSSLASTFTRWIGRSGLAANRPESVAVPCSQDAIPA